MGCKNERGKGGREGGREGRENKSPSLPLPAPAPTPNYEDRLCMFANLSRLLLNWVDYFTCCLLCRMLLPGELAKHVHYDITLTNDWLFYSPCYASGHCE